MMFIAGDTKGSVPNYDNDVLLSLRIHEIVCSFTQAALAVSFILRLKFTLLVMYLKQGFKKISVQCICLVYAQSCL